MAMVLGAAIWLPSSSHANPAPQDFQACLAHLSGMERLQQIPTQWLMAISSIESGRYHNGLKMTLPWPWTANVEGKGYYFDSKAEAVAAVSKFLKQGYRSIDVGCMQINLRHHPNAFRTLEQAFDPGSNVAYGAKFLRSNYDSTRSWMTATAHYHSQTPSRGSDYYRKVYERWRKIANRFDPNYFNSQAGKLQLASLQQPMQSSAALPRHPFMPQTHKAVRLNSIQVGNQKSSVRGNASVTREKGVLVIRPQRNVTIAKVEETKPAEKSAADSNKKGQFKPKGYVDIGNVTTQASAATASPKFIFY
jgi:hypothetical protein